MNRNDCLEDWEISHEDVDVGEEQRLSGLYYNFYTVRQLSSSVPGGLSFDRVKSSLFHDQSVEL